MNRTVGGRRAPDAAAVSVTLAAVAFFGLFGHLMVTAYRRFALNAFDLAIFDQGLWLLGQLRTPFVTVRGLHLFADHSSYILVGLAPLYRLLPYQETLILFSVAVMAAGAPLAYWAAREIGASRPLSGTVAIGYLMHPAVSWNARDGFHPEQIVLPLIIGAFILLARQKDGWAVLAVVVALTAKEDVALIAVPFGLFVWWWFGRRGVGLAIVALSVGALLINFLFLLPHFSPTGELLYSSRYARLGSGPFDVAIGVLTHPRVVFDAVIDPWHIGYVAAMVLPIPLALREPRALAMAIPAVAANLLSSHTYQALINYHYTVYPLIAVVIAGVLGASALTGWIGRAKKAVIVASVVASLAFVPMSGVFGFTAEPPAGRRSIEAAIAAVPTDAEISAWNRFVPHLTHRETVYEFTNPWVRLNYAAPGLPLPDPATVEWVLARRRVDEDLVGRLLDSGEFVEVVSGDSFRLLHRSVGESSGATPSMRASHP